MASVRGRSGVNSVCAFASVTASESTRTASSKRPSASIDPGLVVNHFEVAWSPLLRQQNLFLGLVQLMKLPVNIGKTQIIVGFLRL